MKVRRLIDKLLEMPQGSDVQFIYDSGVMRIGVDTVYVSRDGKVVLASRGEPIYVDAARPVDAPSASDKPDWVVK